MPEVEDITEQEAAKEDKYKLKFGEGGKKDNVLFMDSLPDADDKEGKEDIEALQSLVYEDETPETLAEHFKSQGNEALKRGKDFYNDAITYYTRAIDAKSCLDANNSVYHSNRAHVYLALGNTGFAVYDARKSVEIDPTNLKGHYRVAKALNLLGKHEEALLAAQTGLKVNSELDKSLLQRELDLARARLEEMRVRQEEKERSYVSNSSSASTRQSRIQATMLKQGILQRHWSAGNPLFDNWGIIEEVYADDSYYDPAANLVHFSSLFVYPEKGQTDFVVDFREDETFRTHFELMFGGDKHPAWDPEHLFGPDTLSVCFRERWVPATNSVAGSKGAGAAAAAAPKKKNPSRRKKGGGRRKKPAQQEQGHGLGDGAGGELGVGPWMAVPATTTLREVLSEYEYVIPKYPVFFITRTGSEEEAKFMQTALQTTL